jgi:hypothetical protein
VDDVVGWMYHICIVSRSILILLFRSCFDEEILI